MKTPRHNLNPNCNGGTLRLACPCLKPTTVEREGYKYCWQHDPERIAMTRRAKWEKRKQEMAETIAMHGRKIERNKKLREAGIENITDETLDKIIKYGGINALIDRQDEKDNGQAQPTNPH